MTPYTRSPIFEQIWGPFYSRALALPGAPGPGKGDPPRVLRASPYGKGKGDGKSDPKGKGKGKGGKPNRVQWVTEVSHNGQRRALCMRFQTGKCTLGDACKFHHGCAYPLPDGRACNKNHGASQHRAHCSLTH